MRAGARRHQLTIQHAVPGVGWNGEPTWRTYVTAWGSLEPLRGEELVRAQQLHAEVRGRSTMPFVPGMSSAMRFLCGERTYEILAVLDPEERHRELQLYWKETVPT